MRKEARCSKGASQRERERERERKRGGVEVGMLGLWNVGREYAVEDLAIFALVAVVGLVVLLAVFWFSDSSRSKVGLALSLSLSLSLCREPR